LEAALSNPKWTSGTDQSALPRGAGLVAEEGMIVATASAAAALLAPLFDGAKGERLAILHLDSEQRMIALDAPPDEAESWASLPLRAIFAAALGHGTAGIVLAHNHPSGDPRPSPADVAATRRFAEIAAALEIRLHDHLVFAGDDCRSFREMGLL
jgi:DNA repair protein RadC